VARYARVRSVSYFVFLTPQPSTFAKHSRFERVILDDPFLHSESPSPLSQRHASRDLEHIFLASDKKRVLKLQNSFFSIKKGVTLLLPETLLIYYIRNSVLSYNQAPLKVKEMLTKIKVTSTL